METCHHLSSFVSMNCRTVSLIYSSILRFNNNIKYTNEGKSSCGMILDLFIYCLWLIVFSVHHHQQTVIYLNFGHKLSYLLQNFNVFYYYYKAIHNTIHCPSMRWFILLNIVAEDHIWSWQFTCFFLYSHLVFFFPIFFGIFVLHETQF